MSGSATITEQTATSRLTLEFVVIEATQIAATLAAQGSFAASARLLASADAALSASGDLAANARAVRGVSLAIGAAASFSSNASALRKVAATVSATGSLAAVAGLIASGSATLAASGSLSASATLIGQNSTAALAASSDLAAVASALRKVSAPLAASGSIAARASAMRWVASNVSAQASILALASATRKAAALLAASGAVSIAASVNRGVSATLAAVGGVSAAGTVTSAGVATFDSTNAFTFDDSASPTFDALAGPQTYTLVDSNESHSTVSLFSSTLTTAATTVHASEAHDVTRVELWLVKEGSPTGAITCYIYNAATVGADTAPDDRAAIATATVDASTITVDNGAGIGTLLTFDFDTPASVSLNDHYTVVIHHGNSDATNRIGWRRAGFINADHGVWHRSAGAPTATDDAANWTEFDVDGSFVFRTYKSP